MVNTRLCEKVRQAFFFGSPRQFDFFNSGTKILKFFKCELDISGVLRCSNVVIK